jgi:hypothetical protein
LVTDHATHEAQHDVQDAHDVDRVGEWDARETVAHVVHVVVVVHVDLRPLVVRCSSHFILILLYRLSK